MRKLSKKISMLMVLAMLVSLFSGVVSASAASSWSFFNKTKEDSIVAQSKTETYKMENNEFADFDMFKDGKTIDTKVYTVKYGSSDADVVFVDAKNGKLRAKGEAGESAKVTAYITNKNTGAKAQRWFVIEIVDGTDYDIVADFADEVVAVGEKLALAATVTADGKEVDATVAFTLDGAAITEFAPAKAGEYTIVATATVDGEVVTEKFVVFAEKNVAELEAVQTSLNAVVLTFNNASAAAKAVADASLITADYVINDLVVASPVRSVAAVEGDDLSVTVTLYNNIIKDLKHTFYYNNGEASDSVIGADSKPAYIKVIGATYEYQTQKDLVVKVYNAQNVDITADADVANKVTWSADLSEDFSVAGDKIFFYNADKFATVKAVYDMGLNENYEEIADLEATGTYYSVKTPDVAYAPHGYKITGSYAGFSLNPIKVAVGDPAFTLDIQYKYKQGTNWPSDYTITGATGTDAGLGFSYKYYSSNKAVVMVGENTGSITPVAPGSTTIYVKRVDANNNNAETTICVIPVTVDGKRALSTFNVAVDGSNKLSVNTDGTNDINNITLKYTAKDLLGDDYESGAVAWSYKFTYPAALKDQPITGYLTAGTPNTTTNQIALDVDYTSDSLQTYLNGVCINGKTYETFKIEVTAKDNANNGAEKKFEVTFLAKVIDTTDATKVKNRVLSWSRANVDMKLSNENTGNYVSDLKLVKTDSDGFYIGDETLSIVNSKAQVTSGSGYCVVLKKNGNVDSSFGAMNGGNTAFTVTPLTVTSNKITKMDKGTYAAELYKADANDNVQSLGVKTLVLTDSTAATSVTLKKDTLASYAPTVAELKDSITFLRGGKDISSYLTNNIVNIDSKNLADGHIYITSVTLEVNADEISDNWAAASEYTEVTFNVNKLFTVQP